MTATSPQRETQSLAAREPLLRAIRVATAEVIATRLQLIELGAATECDDQRRSEATERGKRRGFSSSSADGGRDASGF